MNVPVKRGVLLRHQGRLYFVEDVVEHHSGKQRPVYHVSLRDVLDGRHIERTLEQLEPVEEVPFSHRSMQYLYARGPNRVFMDSESFEEIELPAAVIGPLDVFLKEGDVFSVMFAQDRPVRLQMPDSVALRVEDTAAPSHAVGNAGSVLKEARLENGLEIRVPLFIKTGDSVRVSTRTREYLGKCSAGE